MPQDRNSPKIAALMGGLLLLLAGCATPAPYAPRLPGQETGYTDRQIDQNRYRITFTGNMVTPREQVEDDLLLRAAEVTLAAGKSHFLFDTRDTEAKTRTRVMTEPGGPWGPYDAFGYGYWRFHPRWGYGLYAPDVDVITTTRYEAFAEIVVLNDEQAAHEPRAVDAHQVIAHLGPAAKPPAP